MAYWRIRSWTFGVEPPYIKLCQVHPSVILLTILSLHLGQFCLLLRLNTHRPGFHPDPDESHHPNVPSDPAWTNSVRTPLQRHSLNHRVSWQEHREFGEDHCAGPMHLVCNLYDKVVKPPSLHMLTNPLSYKTLDPQEVKTNFKGRQSTGAHAHYIPFHS